MKSSKTVHTTQVDASYSNKYSYSVDGASLLRTKLSPVPPPAILEDRIREVMDLERDYIEKINSNLAIAYNPDNASHVEKVHGAAGGNTDS